MNRCAAEAGGCGFSRRDAEKNEKRRMTDYELGCAPKFGAAPTTDGSTRRVNGNEE
jgi:hypothetical protein